MTFIDCDMFYKPDQTPMQVCDEIKKRLGEDQDVMLWGYPKGANEHFPRASDELYALEKEIGPVRIVHVINNSDIE